MVSYNYRHFHRTGREQNHQMILHTDDTQSKFYQPVTAYLDSLESTPEGRDQYKAISMAAFMKNDIGSMPKRSVNMYVITDKSAKTYTVYDGNSVVGDFVYTEPVEYPAWEIGDSTSTILGYECSIATALYRGREWTAWFTTDIPLAEGPWKLSGLPGLVLEAYENSGQHRFTADGISVSDKRVTPIYTPEKYEKTDRISLLKTLRAYEDNPLGAIEGLTGTKITVAGGVEFDLTLDFLETDYR